MVGTLAALAAEPAASPHVQLGTRRADDPRGYVDPLTLLPPRPASPPAAAPDARHAGSAACVGRRRARAGRGHAGRTRPRAERPCRSGARSRGPTGVGETLVETGIHTGGALGGDALAFEAPEATAKGFPFREARQRAGDAGSARGRAAGPRLLRLLGRLSASACLRPPPWPRRARRDSRLRPREARGRRGHFSSQRHSPWLLFPCSSTAREAARRRRGAKARAHHGRPRRST